MSQLFRERPAYSSNLFWVKAQTSAFHVPQNCINVHVALLRLPHLPTFDYRGTRWAYAPFDCSDCLSVSFASTLLDASVDPLHGPFDHHSALFDGTMFVSRATWMQGYARLLVPWFEDLPWELHMGPKRNGLVGDLVPQYYSIVLLVLSHVYLLTLREAKACFDYVETSEEVFFLLYLCWTSLRGSPLY